LVAKKLIFDWKENLSLEANLKFITREIKANYHLIKNLENNIEDFKHLVLI
jgi:hypothetical protein